MSSAIPIYYLQSAIEQPLLASLCSRINANYGGSAY